MHSATDRTDKNGTLLSFRNADTYWLSRARHTTGPKRLGERALFYRKAMEGLSSPSARLELAETYYRMQCYDAADALILEVLEEDPGIGQAWYLLGLTSLARGDEITSQNAFDRCMREAPLSPAAVRSQDMLTMYAWSDRDRIPLFGFRADCLMRRARSCPPGPERTALCIRACLKRPGPDTIFALISEISPTHPRLCLKLLPWALSKGKLRFRACLKGAECLHRIGRDPLPYLLAALPLAVSASDTESLTRCALSCGKAAFMADRLGEMLSDAPFSSGLMSLRADCLHAQGRFCEADSLRSLAMKTAPEAAERPDSTGSLKKLAVYHSRLHRGRLNRLLHRLVISMSDTVSPGPIYRIVPDLYRAMSRDARRNMDKPALRTWDTAFSVLLELRIGRADLAKGSLRDRRYRRFVLRQIRRVDKGLYRYARSLVSPGPDRPTPKTK